MQGKMASVFIALFLFLCFAAAYFAGAFTPQSREPLRDAQKQIDQQAEETHRMGHNSRVTFFAPDADAMVVLLPAYAVVKDVEKLALDSSVMDEMQRDVNSVERGHLYYIRQGRIKDHKTLSDLVEPVAGFSSRQETNFLISDEETSGRPVRVEITPN